MLKKLVILFLIAIGTSRLRAESLESSIDALASPNSAVQNSGLIYIKGHIEPGLLPLLKALDGGTLYLWKKDKKTSRVILAGESKEIGGIDKAQLLDPISSLPIPGEIYESLDAMERIQLNPDARALLRSALSGARLFDRDRSVRKDAAERLGDDGDASSLVLLSRVLNLEKDRWTRHAIQQAIYQIQLLDPDPKNRLNAAVGLGKIKGNESLPKLKDILSKNQEKDVAVREAVQSAIRKIERYQKIEEIAGTLFDGLSLGSILLLMGLGLAIIFGLMGVINMAHGEIMMLGAYTAFVVQQFFTAHFPPQYQDYYFPISLILSILVAGGFGFVLEKCLIRFLYGRPLETLLATWGVSMILQQGARGYFGDLTSVNAPNYLRGGTEVMAGLVLPYNRIFIIGLTVICLAVIHILIDRTRMGLRIRAVTQNRRMSGCLGIRTPAVDSWTFALGAALAGLAGCGLTLIGNVDPEMGRTYIVDSFLVVVVGGVGKLMGSVTAALGIGFLNKILEPMIGGTGGAIYAKVFVLVGIILFLQRKPSGLFPAKGRAAESE